MYFLNKPHIPDVNQMAVWGPDTRGASHLIDAEPVRLRRDAQLLVVLQMHVLLHTNSYEECMCHTVPC